MDLVDGCNLVETKVEERGLESSGPVAEGEVQHNRDVVAIEEEDELEISDGLDDLIAADNGPVVVPVVGRARDGVCWLLWLELVGLVCVGLALDLAVERALGAVGFGV